MKLEIDVQKREQSGKGVARQLRRNGKIPAVLYGKGKSLLLSMDPKVARSVILSQTGHTGLLTIRISDGAKQEERVAVLQDRQMDPITGGILHVDFFEVSMDKAIRVKVPVTIVGEIPRGVKDGGILHQPIRELHIECLPAQIPDHIEVDGSELQIGQGVHVQEITIPAGVKVLDDENVMVVHVTTKMSEAKLEALLTREVQEGQIEAPAPAPEKAKVEEAPAAPAPETKAKEEKK